LDKKPEKSDYSDLILLDGEYLTGDGDVIVIEVSRDKIRSFDWYGNTRGYTLDRFIERVNNF
jgi:predicted RNA-binding protein